MTIFSLLICPLAYELMIEEYVMPEIRIIYKWHILLLFVLLTNQIFDKMKKFIEDKSNLSSTYFAGRFTVS